MKKIINPLLAMALAIVFSLSVKAQNLVPNPSFEQYDTCPTDIGQISRAVGWHSARMTPDYYNVCSTDTFQGGHFKVSVPSNWVGYRTAASGNGYAGLISCTSESEMYKEYIGAQLITPLQIGTRYYVSFKVSLAIGGNPANSCGLNMLGALFSTIQYSSASAAPTCNCAQIVSDSIITDTLNWTRITGSFIADSAYSCINIGRFAYDSSTTVIELSIGTDCYSGYYYIDDIAVSEDSAYTYNYSWAGIQNLSKESPISIYPNPANDFITIENKDYSINELKIFNAIGELVKIYSVSNTQVYTINLNGLSQGIYYLVSYTKSQNQINYKLIKL